MTDAHDIAPRARQRLCRRACPRAVAADNDMIRAGSYEMMPRCRRHRFRLPISPVICRAMLLLFDAYATPRSFAASPAAALCRRR